MLNRITTTNCQRFLKWASEGYYKSLEIGASKSGGIIYIINV
jgi:hypothetical protein